MVKKILLKFENISIPAALNDTLAAKDFEKRLPVVLTGRKWKDNYCFPTAIGCYDPEETQAGWKNGDISLAAGSFRILFDGQEESADTRGIMVIGHICEQQLKQIRDFPKTVRISIEMAVGE